MRQSRYVPLEAFQSLERAHNEAEQDRAALKAKLVQERIRMQVGWLGVNSVAHCRLGVRGGRQAVSTPRPTLTLLRLSPIPHTSLLSDTNHMYSPAHCTALALIPLQPVLPA